jgi:ABC-2 family transporter protein
VPTADEAGPDRVLRRKLRRAVLLLVLAGAVVQLALSAYYLGVGHSPGPRHLPVGFVADAQQQGQLQTLIERGDAFDASRYADAGALTAAIKKKQIYAGVDVTSARPHLYVASAAGTAASSAIRTAFTTVLQQRTEQQVSQLVAAGRPVPPATLQALTAPPDVTDLAPLPAQDRAGGSLGLLVQALALGATVASLGLGRIGERTRRSLQRGLAHAATLIVYAAASAAAVLWAASWFGIVPGSAAGRIYLDLFLLSLAITASSAACVALVGPAGALLGTLYFTLGVIISGSSILPEFLPTFGRIVGQSLPTGAGVTAIRESRYFPAASTTGPLTVLSLYAGIGLLVVLVTNLLANRSHEESVVAELRAPEQPERPERPEHPERAEPERHPRPGQAKRTDSRSDTARNPSA